VSLILLNNHQIGFSVSVRKSEKIAPDRCVSIQETRGARGFDLRQYQTVGYLAIYCSTGELPRTWEKSVVPASEPVPIMNSRQNIQ